MNTRRIAIFGFLIATALLALIGCSKSRPTATLAPPTATSTSPQHSAAAASTATSAVQATPSATVVPTPSSIPPTGTPTPTTLPSAIPPTLVVPTGTPTLTPVPVPIGWVRQDAAVAANLLALDCSDNQICVVVGEDSTVLLTTNGGTEWRSAAAGIAPGLRIKDVDCPDENTCYAASTMLYINDGYAGPAGDLAVIKTTDGGDSWSAAGAGVEGGLLTVTCPTRDTCYAAGDSGAVHKTRDGGSTWSSLPLPPLLSFYQGKVFCSDPNTCYLFGSSGVFVKTTDGGSTWVEQTPGTDFRLSAMDCATDGTACYGLSFSEILKTVDGGISWMAWTKPQGDEGSEFTALHCIDDDSCFAVATSGIPYKTTDGGDHWKGQFVGPDQRVPLTDIDCPLDSATCYAVGQNGAILKTTDGGASPPSGWAPLASGVTDVINHIECPVSDKVCYAAGGRIGYDIPTFVLKTTDGGSTWTTVLSETELGPYNLHCRDDAACYAAGGAGILKTGDGWDTWSNVGSEIASVGISSVDCPEPSVCYAAGGYSAELGIVGKIFKTVDDGVVWSSVYTETDALTGALHCPVDGDTCYALNTRIVFTEDDFFLAGDVLKTNDGGESWSTVHTADVSLASVHCPVDDETCFVVGGGVIPGLGDAAILKTEDGGQTWSSLTSGLADMLYDIHCPGELTCYVAAGHGTMLKTQDGGESWSVQFLGTVTQMHSVFCTEENTCYVAGYGGTILKTTTGGGAGPSSVIPIDIRLPTPTPTPGPTPTPTPPPFEPLTVVDNFSAADLVFDGESMWASSTIGGSVVKLGLDGTVVNSTAVGSATGLAFDGKNVWVALGGVQGRVGKLAPDGTFLGIYEMGSSPRGLLFDEESIWVANLDDPSVTRLALDGTLVGTYTGGAEAGSLLYESLAFDGEHLWLASSFSDVVTKLSRDGQTLGTFTVGSGAHNDIAFDGESIWVTNLHNSVTKLALDGREIDTFEVFGSPQALLFDGQSMWIGVDGFLISLGLDGAELSRVPVDGWPQALAFDGTSVWTANSFGATGHPIQKLTLIEEGALTPLPSRSAPSGPTPTASPMPTPFQGEPTHWGMTYGSQSGVNVYFGSVQVAIDGGFLLGGSFALPRDTDAWVLKLNLDGTVAWQKTYGGSGHDYGDSIVNTSDGGILLAASTRSFGSDDGDAWLLKLNDEGAVIWQKTFARSESARIASVQETNDGGYVATGFTCCLGEDSIEAWLLRLSSDGTIVWEKTYGGSHDDRARSIQETSDGGFVVVADTHSFGAGGTDVWILKLDKDGTIVWQKTYGGSDYDSAYSIIETSDGGYVTAGMTYSFGAGRTDVWVLKLDKDGTVVWQKTYGGSDADVASSIVETGDGGYVVAANTESFGAGDVEIWVFKLNRDGAVDWQKTYGWSGEQRFASIQDSGDGGFVLAGNTAERGALVLYMDSMGDIPGCNIIGASDAVVTDTTVVGQTSAATVQPSAAAVTVTDVVPQDGSSEAFWVCPGTGQR